MPDVSHHLPLKSLWTEKLRPGLHNPENWSKTDNNCKLIYAPTGAGFFGLDQMKRFCQDNKVVTSIWNSKEDIQCVNCFVDESTGQIFDEFVLNWTQKESRMEWMLPGIDLPLQKYRLSFVISAKIDLTNNLLKNVRVYWDQGSFLLQSGILMRSVRNLVRSGSSEALENALVSLPISTEYSALLSNNSAHFLTKLYEDKEDKKNNIGALNNITSILSDLPHSTYGPAVMTPQRPTTTRSLNPALLGSLKLGDSAFDSPVPVNSRSVKTRNIFFDEEDTLKTQSRGKAVGLFDRESDSFRPGLAVNQGCVKNSQSHVFDQDSDQIRQNPLMHLNENYINQYESQIFNMDKKDLSSKGTNLAQTDKVLFESHVFDSNKLGTLHSIPQLRASTGPSQDVTQILSPEEDLKCAPESLSSTLGRPGMLGHFRGSSLGDTLNSSNEEVKFRPSTAIRFDPNRSQIVLGGYCDDEEEEEETKVNNSLNFTRFQTPTAKSSVFN